MSDYELFLYYFLLTMVAAQVTAITWACTLWVIDKLWSVA